MGWQLAWDRGQDGVAVGEPRGEPWLSAQGLALLESRASPARALSLSQLLEMPPGKESRAMGLREAGNNLPSCVLCWQECCVLGKADVRL